MEDTYTICNPREEPIYGNIVGKEEQHTPTKEDIYDDVVPEEESYHSYINNPSILQSLNNTSISFEYNNPVFSGTSTKSIPEQRVEVNTQNKIRKEQPTKQKNCGICSVFILLLITVIAVIGIGIYYHILFTDSFNKLKLENNDLILATISKLNSKEPLVKQKAQNKGMMFLYCKIYGSFLLRYSSKRL